MAFLFLMELVALLSEGKGSWAQVSGLIKQGEWDNILLLGNDFARKFTVDGNKKYEFIEIKDLNLIELKQQILEKLKNKIKGTEVALSIASANGKEHMALISALLSIPVGIRFTALTKQGIVFM